MKEYESHRAQYLCACQAGKILCIGCYQKFDSPEDFDKHIDEIMSRPKSCGCRR